ncbi:hypothetical protein FACS1894163_04570 [Spirochaetia bacterium]|nr:hypothetical protein FACS1894163_04570 [Spirochaetia bacterium]
MKERANYRRIGDYVELVDERNFEFKVDTLLGVSINKYFMPSVANIVGTDLSNYKIIKKNQFACSLMQVSRDEKIPIDCLTDYDIAMVSPAYAVFKVSDATKLLPQYLSMWFKRSEFDREASFLGVGGIRGSMTWDDFCNMEFPLPSIERQKAVVNVYKTVADRIMLKQKINEKLEATLTALYSEYFRVSDNNSLPNGWHIGNFSEIAEIVMGQSPEGDDCNNDAIGEPLLNGPTEFGTYSPTAVQWTTDPRKYCTEGDLLFCVRGSTTGRMNWANRDYAIGRGLAAIRHRQGKENNWFIKAMIDAHLPGILAAATGSTFPNVGKDLLNDFKVIIPSPEAIAGFEKKGYSFLHLSNQNAKETGLLVELSNVLLSNLIKDD